LWNISSVFKFFKKEFFFPDKQPEPHGSWEKETEYLKNIFPDGEAYVFGPRSCDHHYSFVVDYTAKTTMEQGTLKPSCTQQSVEILMTGLDRKVMQQFYMDKDFISSDEVTKRTGIADLMPGVQLDAHQFDPLGYSLNGLDGGTYYTIHITPQPECSFVSFECNVSLSNYSELVQSVVALFKPTSFTVLLFSETFCTNSSLGKNYEGFYLRNAKHHKYAQHHDYNLNFISFKVYDPIIISPQQKLQKRNLRMKNTNHKQTSLVEKTIDVL